MGQKDKSYKKSLRDQIKKLEAEKKELNKEKSKLEDIINSTMHELREFSAVITNKCYSLTTQNDIKKNQKELIDNIFFMSGMLSARLNFTEIEINPRTINNQVSILSGIYKKFDKTRYLLSHIANEKSIRIDFNGNSHMEMKLKQAFELIPFVILQNAIKYSPPGYAVDVTFEQEYEDTLSVSVVSYGPPLEDSEVALVFERGYRGKNAMDIEGQGLGLHLAKRICDLHAISLKIEQGKWLPIEISGNKFRQFIVKLIFEYY